MSRKQINASLPEGQAIRIRQDAIRLGITLADWMEVATEKFLAQPVETRRAFTARFNRKVTGRKVAP